MFKFTLQEYILALIRLITSLFYFILWDFRSCYCHKYYVQECISALIMLINSWYYLIFGILDLVNRTLWYIKSDFYQATQQQKSCGHSDLPSYSSFFKDVATCAGYLRFVASPLPSLHGLHDAKCQVHNGMSFDSAWRLRHGVLHCTF